MIDNNIYNLGLFDKNGIELKSNSNIMFNNHIGKISYSRESARFIITWDDGSRRNIDTNFARELKVLED